MSFEKFDQPTSRDWNSYGFAASRIKHYRDSYIPIKHSVTCTLLSEDDQCEKSHDPPQHEKRTFERLEKTIKAEPPVRPPMERSKTIFLPTSGTKWYQ